METSNYYQTISFERASNKTSDTLEFFSLAPTPHNEQCTPAGEDPQDQIKECTALIKRQMDEGRGISSRRTTRKKVQEPEGNRK